MSYARMSGDFSDLYLISTWYNMDDDKSYCWQCISCKMEPIKTAKIDRETRNFWLERAEEMLDWNPPTEYKFRPTVNLFSIKAVYRHLRHHIMRGHKVPIEAIQRVLAEYYDIDISRLQELWPYESWQFEACSFCNGIQNSDILNRGPFPPECDGECGAF